ncbi:hypothetical protein [Pseudanabaena sp. 'Roaring Creek']|uniref:hypothetical protein n=1 Tax=Pseudanabaena sp. 'Roaring Creek' TaxID=1681830 RepID=UPI0006D76DAB|nr:hypothetical protein [Pseudanabaena sp. 'Roaring Creek']
MACKCGSKKKNNAPDTFVLGEGSICFLLGLDSPLCPLLDKIPSLIGKPWKDILKTVAKKVFNIVINEITGAIDTANFCLVEPTLPSEITYGDVFNWLISYVPEIGLLSSPDSLLAKITQYYLYQKYFDYCECNKCPDPPPPPDSSSSPAYSASCAAAKALEPQINEIISSVNQLNTPVNEAWIQPSISSSSLPYDRFVNQEALLTYINNRFPPPGYVFSFEADGSNDAQAVPTITTRLVGCATVYIKTRAVIVTNSQKFRIRQLMPDGSYSNLGTWQTFNYSLSNSLVWVDDGACCSVVPPNNSFPSDVVLPPPDFIKRFPDEGGRDPNCNEEFIDVPVFVDCGDRGSIRLALNVSGRDETISVKDTVLCKHPQSNMVLKTCLPSVPGCMDSTATNYNPLATVDDGSCNYDNFDCTTLQEQYTTWGTNDATYYKSIGADLPSQLQYMLSSFATNPDYTSHPQCATLFNQWYTDAWNNYLNPPQVSGCMDSTATNYNPLATVDDGSCNYDNFDCTTLQEQYTTYGTNDATYYKSIGADLPSTLQYYLSSFATNPDYTSHPQCATLFNQWYTDAWNAVADSP